MTMQLLALALSLFLQAEDPAQPKTLALRGARIYTGSRAPLDAGIVLIEKGKIAAVGKDVAIPTGAQVLDVTGKVLIPGLIDAASRLFVPPTGERSPGSAEQRVVDGLDFFQRDVDE